MGAFRDICTLLNFQNVGDKITERIASFLAVWFRDGLVCRVISRRSDDFPAGRARLAVTKQKIIVSAAHAGSATCPGTNGEES